MWCKRRKNLKHLQYPPYLYYIYEKVSEVQECKDDLKQLQHMIAASATTDGCADGRIIYCLQWVWGTGALLSSPDISGVLCLRDVEWAWGSKGKSLGFSRFLKGCSMCFALHITYKVHCCSNWIDYIQTLLSVLEIPATGNKLLVVLF